MICPTSWPLPAINRASPGCSAAIPVRIASARSPISLAPFAAVRIAARMDSGFSLRVLSSVTIMVSAFLRAVEFAHRGLPAQVLAAAMSGRALLRNALDRGVRGAMALACPVGRAPDRVDAQAAGLGRLGPLARTIMIGRNVGRAAGPHEIV